MSDLLRLQYATVVTPTDRYVKHTVTLADTHDDGRITATVTDPRTQLVKAIIALDGDAPLQLARPLVLRTEQGFGITLDDDPNSAGQGCWCRVQTRVLPNQPGVIRE